ncbi:MAG: GNAT family N-acetyltransferase [Phototrophicales bacterium]|nr:GNAT family N-acetyltransferase [Phototrophicales bacterium]
MSSTSLIRPDIAYKDSYITAMHEFKAEKLWHYTDLDIEQLERDFDDYISGLLMREHTVPAGWVTETLLWLVDEKGFIGRISFRHYLTDSLQRFGGHIGYEVRPTRRNEGHGTAMLHEMLPIARAKGLDKVMLTCDDDNLGSQKIIITNGGVLEDVIQNDFRPVPTMRWWITL